jgi:hypothetical protein
LIATRSDSFQPILKGIIAPKISPLYGSWQGFPCGAAAFARIAMQQPDRGAK